MLKYILTAKKHALMMLKGKLFLQTTIKHIATQCNESTCSTETYLPWGHQRVISKDNGAQ